MQWWNEFVNWLQTTDGHRAIFLAALVFVAVVVAVLITAAATRSSIKRLIATQERQLRNSVVATLVDAATEASVWNSLTPGEQVLNDRAVGQADILLRLMPVKGAGTTANWVAHELAELKRNSATFGYQLEPAVAEFRDRLLDWLSRPSRARKAFQADLDRWKFAATEETTTQTNDQEAWVAKQHHTRHTQNTSAPVPAQAVVAPEITTDASSPTASSPAASSPAAPVRTKPEVDGRSAESAPPAPKIESGAETRGGAETAPVAQTGANAAAPGVESSAAVTPVPDPSPAPASTTYAGPREPSTATAQTKQLLADVAALDVRKDSPEPVEEFPPLPDSPSSWSRDSESERRRRSADDESGPRGTL